MPQLRLMYERFSHLNGDHAWRKVSPEGYIDYLARYRPGGRVLYFNFPLAKELELISKRHPVRMNPQLERVILDTFSIQIVNEYDLLNESNVLSKCYKDRVYMATRYLQLQHVNKQGKTSGDGRSVWNGWLPVGRKRFDISSCGTGATILSPGAQDANEPVKTGDETHGFSCGLADIDEMLSAAIMSEVFYRKGIPTERCLAVIDYDDNTSICVRTAPNLIRPAHLYRYLKSSQYKELKSSYNYFINCQVRNGFLNVPKSGKKRYQITLSYFAKVYAKLAAVMEEEYIFNWLAWDGDNMLASGAILDYGSIRQFAAKHNKYRYEDVDRFSTSLSEQRYWARILVQTFAQAADYILTGERKRLEEFKDHKCLIEFDELYEMNILMRTLHRIGFTDKQSRYIYNTHPKLIKEFRKVLNYFEDAKIGQGQEKTSDGIDHPPIFLIRNILRELPIYLLNLRIRGSHGLMPAKKFCSIMAASYANKKDLKISENRTYKSKKFQGLYMELIHCCSGGEIRVLEGVASRSSVINYEFRSTGDGLIWVVNGIIRAKKTMNRHDIQAVINRFIESQVLIPEKWKPIKDEELLGRSMKARLMRRLQRDLQRFKERI